MERVPNKNVIGLLNLASDKLEIAYYNCKNEYEKTIDYVRKEELINEANKILAERQEVLSYLQKYSDLFKALNNSDYSVKSKIIKDIDTLESEVTLAYNPKENNSAAVSAPADNYLNTQGLEKGGKYTVKEISQGVNNGFWGLVNGAISVFSTWCAIDAIKCLLSHSGAFMVLGAVPYIPATILFTALAIGTFKGAKERTKRVLSLINKS